MTKNAYTQFNTPILFLIFNRPDTTLEVFNQIQLMKPKFLFIAADGPRENKVGEYEACMKAREIIKRIDWDCEVMTLFRERNLGCGIAVSSAITWFLNQVEYGIILEDDCVPALSFFDYCEYLLKKYKDDKEVMHISGSNFQNKNNKGETSYYFSYYPHIWGWATWRRAWAHYDFKISDSKHLFNSVTEKKLISRRERNHLRKKLMKVESKEINTWDYQWFFSILKNNGFAITPNCNLVINIGVRNSPTHKFLRDSSKEISILEEIDFPLVDPSKKIDFEADLYTFNNTLSHSHRRLFRLFMENSSLTILKYVFNEKILTNSNKNNLLKLRKRIQKCF
ncbi:MAG: hypothetical protein M9933_10940 [Chitinophagaceae bacterium]|nr:hypothetical protein [Chitinophagaceae bacterium]